MRILMYVALLPGIILMVYLYRQDKVEKEPISLLALLLVGGLLSAIASSFLEEWADSLLKMFFDHPGRLYQIVDAFLAVALIEEGTKYFFLKKFSWNNYNFNCLFDGVIYATFVSLGFALTENVLYVLSYGFDTAVMRAFTAIPAHTAFGIIMGIFYGNAKYAQNIGIKKQYHPNKFLSLFIPVLIHGLYDYCLFDGSDYLMIIWYVLLFVIYVIIFVIVSKKAKSDHEII
ncbi:MAG: PrsW family intramembrane metalloprotease [Erysipelotrichia bacterium]|nr:PrsW family intramembrane metalloprotease [Erysipelotrichia bacterium]